MQTKQVEVEVSGDFLSVFMTVCGKQVELTVDLLKRGPADDEGADPVKLVFKQVFGVCYSPTVSVLLQEHDVPADWLAKKVAEVDSLMKSQEPFVKYA